MMKRNLQKELEDIIKKEEALGNRPRLLLHACCGPCSSYCMEYLEKHLRVLSGFYGIVKPSTGICAYRLEMQARIDYEGYDNLYDYWAEDIVKELTRDGDKEILNLASKEYSKCVYRYEKSEALSIKDVDFCEIISGKAKQKATLAKMARGELVRLMAKQQITDLEKIKKLKVLDFEYCKERSDDKHFVFVKNRA